MTLMRKLQCLLQHYPSIRIFAPSGRLEAEGVPSELDQFGDVVDRLREYCAQRSVDLTSSLLAAQQALEEYVYTEHEAQLRPCIGSLVNISDSVFRRGRLEGVVPGVAWITARESQELPAEPVARFRERMRYALPFATFLVEVANDAA